MCAEERGRAAGGRSKRVEPEPHTYTYYLSIETIAVISAHAIVAGLLMFSNFTF